MPDQPHYIKDRTCTDGKPCSGVIVERKYGKKWACPRCGEEFAGYIVEPAKSDPKPAKGKR